ncbi:hypothetical protein EDC04DRAFT_2612567 [Pisolithus marmoratus]|nr:hypothetical protein EDC04DRAFT_2612567 [Pisolithus marmoratus]
MHNHGHHATVVFPYFTAFAACGHSDPKSFRIVERYAATNAVDDQFILMCNFNAWQVKHPIDVGWLIVDVAMHIWGNVGEFFQRGKPSLIITPGSFGILLLAARLPGHIQGTSAVSIKGLEIGRASLRYRMNVDDGHTYIPSHPLSPKKMGKKYREGDNWLVA